MKFAITGNAAGTSKVPPTIAKAFALLDSLPPKKDEGAMLSIVALAQRIGCATEYLRRMAPGIDWQGRRIRHGQSMLYGHSDTIKAYAKAYHLSN